MSEDPPKLRLKPRLTTPAAAATQAEPETPPAAAPVTATTSSVVPETSAPAIAATPPPGHDEGPAKVESLPPPLPANPPSVTQVSSPTPPPAHPKSAESLAPSIDRGLQTQSAEPVADVNGVQRAMVVVGCIGVLLVAGFGFLVYRVLTGFQAKEGSPNLTVATSSAPAAITPAPVVADPVRETAPASAAQPVIIPEPPKPVLLETPSPATVNPSQPVAAAPAPTPAPAFTQDVAVEPAPTPTPIQAVAASPAPSQASAPVIGTDARNDFRSWVANVKIAGVRAGPRPRILIGNASFNRGDVVEPSLGIVFVDYDANRRLVRFRDATGAVLERRDRPIPTTGVK